MSKIKLSPKQKEVILAMRNKTQCFRWQGVPYSRFEFYGKTFRYDMGCKLQDSKLIQPSKGNVYGRYYELTELGKTIDLT